MNPPNATPSGGIDPSEILQGHNGQHQRFELRRSLVITDPRRKRQCREFLLEDQFGNVYLVYRSTLKDGEDYDVGDWLKPSVLASYGGFTDACLDDFRSKAFHAFARASADIDRLRSIANEVAYGLMPANLSGQN